MHQVFAVVLAYNRKELLKRCLDAIYSQTRPCDGVIVIDNASQDGTQQFLLEAGYPNLKAYVLSRNIGAAGGFNAGFRLAYQHGADFVWMMDDDVIPQVDALQLLLKADERLRRRRIDRAFLLSTALTQDGTVTDTPALNPRLNEVGYPGWPELLEYGLVPVRRATFVSILVPRSTLVEHGVPIASMFIWGEDTEYTLRITRDKPGFLVGASKAIHLREQKGPLNILSESDPVRTRYHRYLIRNQVFIARKHYRFYMLNVLEVFRILFKLLRRGMFHKARFVLQGLLESVFFYPHAEAVDAPIDTLKVSIRLLETPSPVSGKAPMSSKAKAIAAEATEDALEEVAFSPGVSEFQSSRGEGT